MTLRSGPRAILLVALMVAAASAGCRKRGGDDEIDQIAASVGETMSSLDESVTGGATTAMLPYRRMPDALEPPLWRRAMDAVIPSAYAATCWEPTFSACSASGVRTKDFNDCTIGLATLSGNVVLTFTRPACVVTTAGDAVTRTANFTLTGLYGGTLEVTSPGGGQTLTKTADGFDYSVGGMERILTGAGGRKLFDVATRTTAPIVVTGSSRADLEDRVRRLRDRSQARGLQGDADREQPDLDQQLHLRVVGHAQRHGERRPPRRQVRVGHDHLLRRSRRDDRRRHRERLARSLQ